MVQRQWLLSALWLSALTVSVGAAGRAPAPEPQEYLDEQTGATVTVGDAPLIFARERSELENHRIRRVKVEGALSRH